MRISLRRMRIIDYITMEHTYACVRTSSQDGLSPTAMELHPKF